MKSFILKKIIEEKLAKSTMMTMVAKALKRDDILIGVEHAGEEFLLQLKPDEKAYLLKYDKVTRPLINPCLFFFCIE